LADALTVPHAVAAIVLCLAGIAKLRAPGTAAAAVGAPPGLVRAFSVYELALGAAALLRPSLSPLLAITYGGLGILTFVLARRAISCGCFGEDEGQGPASVTQSILSLALALAAVAPAHGAAWILQRSVPTAAVLVAGICAAAYGTVVAYAEVPPAWRAWSAT
jgi:hypothetical protein